MNKGVEFHLDLVDNIYSKFDAVKIFNIDQSEFNYTPLFNRTLSFTGKKITTIIIPQLNARIHSYTIQPILSIEGKLISPMMICLQEVSDKFPTYNFPITKTL